MFFCYSVRLVTNSSFEIAAHIAVHDRFSKGITLVVLPILFSCQGTDVREGRLECQTPTSVSSEISPAARRNCVRLGGFVSGGKERSAAGRLQLPRRYDYFQMCFRELVWRSGNSTTALPPPLFPCFCTNRCAVCG